MLLQYLSIPMEVCNSRMEWDTAALGEWETMQFDGHVVWWDVWWEALCWTTVAN